MSDRTIVILHGWSDISSSFAPLARLLRAKLGGREIAIVHLADYITMEDEVRFDDLVSAMERAWRDNDLPTGRGGVDAIVHSTGALVMRDWLQRNYEPRDAPIKNLVMLAPANFGSPLAHKGRSLPGRIWKGFIGKVPPGAAFQTGTRILKGLELASPHTWELAERDRFGDGGTMYSQGNVLCTVRVGQNAIRALIAGANEDGWDGTVRVATANMDCARMRVIFPRDPDGADPVVHEPEPSSGMTAFGILDSHEHGTIKLTQARRRLLADVENMRRDGSLFFDIVKSLTVTDDRFETWRDELSMRNDALLDRAYRARRPEKHAYQNTVIRVEDQYGVGVEDYLLEFFERDDDRTRNSRRLHRAAFRSVHAYSDDRSYRSFYIDCTSLFRSIDRNTEFLGVSICAHPEMEGETPVGFAAFGQGGRGGLRIMHRDLHDFFAPNRTLLLTLQLTRQQSGSVFK
ncbi:MAG: hypothetical protein F4186_08665, partial [Boseongicola sp. SB0676_bin_33]|nr:hypothetical protein [Boseongicola sp. SB0676_bin_33]